VAPVRRLSLAANRGPVAAERPARPLPHRPAVPRLVHGCPPPPTAAPRAPAARRRPACPIADVGLSTGV
jgi:hypothetical protein